MNGKNPSVGNYCWAYRNNNSRQLAGKGSKNAFPLLSNAAKISDCRKFDGDLSTLARQLAKGAGGELAAEVSEIESIPDSHSRQLVKPIKAVWNELSESEKDFLRRCGAEPPLKISTENHE